MSFEEWFKQFDGVKNSRLSGAETLVASAAWDAGRADLEKQLAERDAALARCVDVIDVEPELPGDIPDEIWYRLKLQVDAGDRLGVSGTLRGIVRATKKAIRQRVALSIPASAQATAKVLAAARWVAYVTTSKVDDPQGQADAMHDALTELAEAIREEKETK